MFCISEHLFSYWKFVSCSADVYFGAPVLILEACIVVSWFFCILEHLFWYWKPVSFSADALYFGALVLILEVLSFSADFVLYFGAPVLILEALSFSADFFKFRNTCSHTGGFVIFSWFFFISEHLFSYCIVFSWFLYNSEQLLWFWKFVSCSADVYFRSTCSHTGSLYRFQLIYYISEHLFSYWKFVSLSADFIQSTSSHIEVFIVFRCIFFNSEYLFSYLKFVSLPVVFCRNICSHTGSLYRFQLFFVGAPVVILEICIVFSCWMELRLHATIPSSASHSNDLIGCRRSWSWVDNESGYDIPQ